MSSISPTLPLGNRLSGAGGSFSGPPESGSRKSTVRSVYLREKDFAVSPAKITFLCNLFKAVSETLNRERESRPRIGSDATFFWDSCSNLEIDDNFRISHNIGLGLAANISTALAIQPDRYRERQ